MKTFGLIWPDGTQELCSIVLDDDGNPRMDTIEPYPKQEGWIVPQVLPLVKIPKPEQGAWEPNVVWFEDRVERQWVAGTPAPAPTFTAAEWVDAQGFAGNRSTTMLYLKLKLDAAQLTSAKLAAVQGWLDGMIVAGVTAPDEKRSDYPAAPFSFEEASAEALSVLAA
jgi:hypothetical protein